MKYHIIVVGLSIACWMAPAYSQTTEPKTAQAIAQGAPTKTTGIEASTVLGKVPLENFFEGLGNKSLRAREVILLPGARIAIHTHDRRPAIAYVLEGELIEHRSDRKVPVIRRQGDAYFETFGVVHWLENTSPNRARVFAVDIIPGAPE